MASIVASFFNRNFYSKNIGMTPTLGLNTNYAFSRHGISNSKVSLLASHSAISSCLDYFCLLKGSSKTQISGPRFPREMALNREGGQWCPWEILMVLENTSSSWRVLLLTVHKHRTASHRKVF